MIEAKLEIRAKSRYGRDTEILLDGKLLTCVRSLKLEFDGEKPHKVIMELYPKNIEIDAEVFALIKRSEENSVGNNGEKIENE